MIYHFVDTHCHFDFPPFAGDEVHSLELARVAGVEALVVPAVSSDEFSRIVALSQQYTNVYAALGLHPMYIDRHNEAALEQLEQALVQRTEKLAAIGEIGLDNYIEQPQLDRQTVLLIEQFELAKRYDLPVILHSRRTHDLLAQMLRKAALARTGVVHGFSGSLEQAEAFVRLGYAIGVGGVITYDRALKTRKAIAALPLSALVLETDAPDMPPFGFQGQPNRPERIGAIFQALCQIRSEPATIIAEQIYDNSRRLFSLG